MHTLCRHPIILLQVGLAVGDIQAVQDEAALQKLALQVVATC